MHDSKMEDRNNIRNVSNGIFILSLSFIMRVRGTISDCRNNSRNAVPLSIYYFVKNKKCQMENSIYIRNISNVIFILSLFFIKRTILDCSNNNRNDVPLSIYYFVKNKGCQMENSNSGVLNFFGGSCLALFIPSSYVDMMLQTWGYQCNGGIP